MNETMRESITITEAINYLNELANIDRKAICDLVNARVRCTETLAAHPTAQVGAVESATDKYEIGMLGLLNGMFGVDQHGWGPIMAIFGEDGDLIGFRHAASPSSVAVTGDFTDELIDEWIAVLPSLKGLAMAHGDVVGGAVLNALSAAIDCIQRDSPPVRMVSVPAAHLRALVSIALYAATAQERIAFIEALVGNIDTVLSK